MPHEIQTYQQAVDYLLGRINYERLAANEYTANDLKLNRMRSLLQALGNPQDQIPVVHIAGTKGKGSTAMMTASILTAAGYRVGLFTSPHISRLEERMTVNGRLPDEGTVVELVQELQSAVDSLKQSPSVRPPTYFEILTSMAWLFFIREKVDIVVLEVGLGGRLDSTNICRPEVTVITNISYDHTQILGETLELIATEKAGIIKRGIPLVNGTQLDEPLEAIRKIAAQREAPVLQLGEGLSYRYEPLRATNDLPPTVAGYLTVCVDRETFDAISLPVFGAHQAHNASLAVAAAALLRKRGWNIPDSAISAGLRTVRCPVRMEIVCDDPLTIVDSAHNIASINAFVDTLSYHFPDRPKCLIFATTKDKPVREMLQLLLPQFETIVLTQYLNNPRGLGHVELLEIASQMSDRVLLSASEPQSAWETARKSLEPGAMICVTGSFFIAAEFRELLQPIPPLAISNETGQAT